MPSVTTPKGRDRLAKRQAAQDRLREQKRLRKQRAEIHAAMEEAIRLSKSKKKGWSTDRNINMERLGWFQVTGTGPVEQRYVRKTP